MRYFLVFLIVSVVIRLNAAEEKYDTRLIPDSLLKNANVVVRYDSTSVRILNAGKAEITHYKVVTILNSHGESYAGAYVVYDRNSKVTSFEGEILDAAGSRIRKIKKDDISDNSLVSSYNLFQDERIKSFEALNHTYPYSFIAIYTMSYDGILNIDRWNPVPGYGVSVEKSVFAISTNGIKINYKPQNLSMPDLQVKKNDAGSIWVLKNLIAFESEPFSPIPSEIFPVLWCTPEKFEYEETKGNYNSWESYGEWQWELNKGKQDLSDETKNKIRMLAGQAETKKGKVKIIYEYLQNKTRYVSIQLGIGGWKPFNASVVDEVGYGDCKALSNYMVSLLNAVNIEAYYTLIGNGTQKIRFPDFPSMGQANHVIVCVPDQNDTIWLECTNQEYPFGYIGKGNSDRYALLITENGGKLVRTPNSEKEFNTQIRKADVVLETNGNGNFEVETKFCGLQFNNRHFLINESKDEQRKWYLRTLSLNTPQINLLELIENSDSEPFITEKLNLYVQKSASVSGNRMFIKPNILNAFSNPLPKAESRKFQVELDFAYTDIDTVRIKLPNGYIIESFPEPILINSDFGNYSASTEIAANDLIYIRKIEMNAGVWPAQKFEEFRNFYGSIWKADQSKVVLVKK